MTRVYIESDNAGVDPKTVLAVLDDKLSDVRIRRGGNHEKVSCVVLPASFPSVDIQSIEVNFRSASG